MSIIPKRLKKEPLIETIWQLQFDSPNAGEVLPGLLFTNLQKQYPNLQIERLPAAEIPSVIGQIDPNLRFAAKVRIRDTKSPLVWQVGDRVLTVNCGKPYIGWDNFFKNIDFVIKLIEESRLITGPMNHSLRYIDLITLDKAPDLSSIQLEVKIGSYSVKNLPLQIRVEIPRENDRKITHILQVFAPAQVHIHNVAENGTLIDIETTVVEQPTKWEDLRSDLAVLHNEAKQFFFEHILSKETIEKLEPEY